ncbi:MAG TPA: methyltransferase domain-containing protein, partial [Isosphaeraceae bacterium]|nr:methyltransferase domain-containing protein [Isosphaeraceae bacterium]
MDDRPGTARGRAPLSSTGSLARCSTSTKSSPGSAPTTACSIDVGGWACPFNRADWVLDSEPFESRGYYATVGLPGSQGGDREHFRAATWVQRDICEHTPWPFPDRFFDFSICSHTLEDVRDPLFVCAELIRVSKRGYIET